MEMVWYDTSHSPHRQRFVLRLPDVGVGVAFVRLNLINKTSLSPHHVVDSNKLLKRIMFLNVT